MVELQRSDDDADIVDDPRRFIELEAVHNFRDLGGYQLGDGRTIAWGRLFRADGLYRLSPSDLEVVRRLGLRTVIDLRSADEVTKHGSFPVDAHPAELHSLAIIDITWADADTPDVEDTPDGAVEFLTWAYGDLIAQGSARFGRAIQLLAADGAGPSVFHCAAGKDRTGVLAALILSGLGVAREQIVADYELTTAGMARLRRWAETQDAEWQTRVNAMPSYMLASPAEAMAATLAAIDAEYGSVRRFLAAVGVSDDVLSALAESITTG